ncbi:MAG: hypothetical protein JW863_20345 [Chitinispirillaceae bacterium]|nr:hypothetical protein [Chitinispirillaceae bacterium]
MDFMDSVGKILPVFFFIIWIIFGAFVKGKAKKAPPDGKPRSGGMGELRKALQRALEEMQGPVTTVEPEASPLERTLETMAMDSSASPEIPDHIEQSVPDSRQGNVLSPVPGRHTRTGRKSLLRKGIILSEILAPPVALRE